MMSLKLSPQLNADPNTALDLYMAYFDQNKQHFPQSCLNLLEDARWHGGYDSMSPHDAVLEKLEFNTTQAEQYEIKILLKKAHMNLKLLITYKNVMKTENLNFPAHQKSLTWRYEQFLHFGPNNDPKIPTTKMLQHDIEWSDGTVWEIYAESISVEWINIT